MSREVAPGTPGRGLTRGELVRRAAGIGAACLVGANARAAVAGPWSSTAAHVQRFVSRPDLVPPVVTVLRSAPGTAPGLLFLAPSSGPGQRGAMIVDAGGEPVWFRPSTPKTTMNFRAALFRSRPVLTWWEGKAEHGLGVGEHVIFDQSYREIARFPAGNGLESDLHEFIVTPEGTALVLAYDIPTVDRSSVGKRRGRVIEGVVQELEIPSARVLFEWRSLDHVALTESHAQVAPAFDYLHANSIDVDGDGDLLLSARNTWAVYKLDRRTGAVIWRLGGKRSDFAMGPGTRFAWQHDARSHPGGLLTLFDNAAAPQVEPQSRGIALRLDTQRMRATLVRQYVHRPPQLAHALGSVQAQANGNILVGWGTEPYFTEYTAGGAVLLDARLPHGRAELPDAPLPVARHARGAPAARSRPGRHAGPVCELERRHRRRRLAAARRAERRRPRPGRHVAAARLRDAPRAAHRGPLRRGGRTRARQPSARADGHDRALTRAVGPVRQTSPACCISRAACWVFPSLIT